MKVFEYVANVEDILGAFICGIYFRLRCASGGDCRFEIQCRGPLSLTLLFLLSIEEHACNGRDDLVKGWRDNGKGDWSRWRYRDGWTVERHTDAPVGMGIPERSEPQAVPPGTRLETQRPLHQMAISDYKYMYEH